MRVFYCINFGFFFQKLTEFISGAKDGVIYFALGTNIKAETFSQTKIKYFLKAFEFFPTYRFLWKYDPNSMIHSIPENILLEKWMPQNDILGSLFYFISS